MTAVTRPLCAALTLIVLAIPVSAQSIDRAKQLFDQAKYVEARTQLVALQKANPRNAAAAYYLGRIATVEGNSDEALQQFERAVALADGNALYHYWLGVAAREEGGRTSGLKQMSNARRMKSEFERAVELDPNQHDARLALVGFYAMAPGVMGGGIDKAREQARELANRDPLRGALARAVIAQHEKNASAEEAALQQAISAAPDTTAGYVALAEMYNRNGKPAEAFTTLDRYLKRHPEDRWGLYHTGRLAGLSGQQLDRGEAALKQFLETPAPNAYAPGIARTHYWLGQIAEKRGAKDVARERYLTALKIDPNSHTSKKALEALK